MTRTFLLYGHTQTQFGENELFLFCEQGATKATGHARFHISCLRNINNIGVSCIR